MIRGYEIYFFYFIVGVFIEEFFELEYGVDVEVGVGGVLDCVELGGDGFDDGFVGFVVVEVGYVGVVVGVENFGVRDGVVVVVFGFFEEGEERGSLGIGGIVVVCFGGKGV